MTHRGPARPLRAGGLALLGVAAVAAVIGTASAVSGDSDDQATPPEEPSASQPAEEPGEETTSEPEETTTQPEASTPASQAPSSRPGGTGEASPTSAPSSTGEPTRPAPGGGKADTAKSAPVRVFNNSTIKGLAGRAAEDLRALGWNVVATGNYSQGIIHRTTVYYRPGTDEQATAEAIAAEFGMQIAPRFEGIKQSSPGVIVIVTKDYDGGK